MVAPAPLWLVPCMLQAKDNGTVSMEALQPDYMPRSKADATSQASSARFHFMNIEIHYIHELLSCDDTNILLPLHGRAAEPHSKLRRKHHIPYL